MKEKYKNNYRFVIKNKNNYVINQHLASVHADHLEDEPNSWLIIQPDMYHDRPEDLEIMSKGEYFGRLGYFSEKDKKLVKKLIEHPRKYPYDVKIDEEAFEKDHQLIVIVSSDQEFEKEEA